MSAVVFVTRERCSLCHLALPLVRRECDRAGHDLAVVDVDAAGWEGVYGDRVPVVLRDGVEVLSGLFERRDVRRALR